MRADARPAITANPHAGDQTVNDQSRDALLARAKHAEKSWIRLAARVAATEAGVIPDAIEDVEFAAVAALHVGANGEIATSGERGLIPHLSVGQWLAEVRERRAIWWRAGAEDDGEKKAPAPNPWTPGAENLTEQSRIYRDSPLRAKRLKEEANAA